MTRAEALRRIADLHQKWSLKHGDDVPYVAADAHPHDGQTSDLAVWQADRSASAGIDDPLNEAIKAILAQIDDETVLVAHLPGKHNQQSHGDGGGVGPDHDDDEFGPSLEEQEGKYGYGRDPQGVDYTEFDVDQETGEPKFTPAYRQKYGPLDGDTGAIGKSGTAVAFPEKGGLHVADDSAGTMNRRVMQEFTDQQATAVSDGMFAVYSGDSPSFTGRGVTVRPAGTNPTRDGIEVTWLDGTVKQYEGEAGDDEAFDLQEALNRA